MFALLLFLLPGLVLGQNYIHIRIDNAGRENLLVYINETGTDAPGFYFIDGGEYMEYQVPQEYEASFYAYPRECADKNCDYPATKVKLQFSEKLLNESYFGMYMVDMTQGFNYKASVGPMFNPVCRDAACFADILEACPDEDRVRNEDNQVVACNTAPDATNLKFLCPDAAIYPPDANVKMCSEYFWEITFNLGSERKYRV